MVLTVPSCVNSASAFASVPSPQWIKYAVVSPSAKFAHTPSADERDGGKSALTCILSAPSRFWG